jgi:hypothetical protein
MNREPLNPVFPFAVAVTRNDTPEEATVRPPAGTSPGRQKEETMNRAHIEKPDVASVLISHMDMLCQVAFGLTKNEADAEILVRNTAVRVLQSPALIEVPYPKGALLTLLRDVFVQKAFGTGVFTKNKEHAPNSEEPGTRSLSKHQGRQETVHVC